MGTTGRGRRLLGVTLAGLLAATLVACGSDDDDDTATDAGASDSDAGGAEAGVGTEADPDAFPVTIEHKYGSTTIEEEPERVAVVGLTEQDALLALGVVPS